MKMLSNLCVLTHYELDGCKIEAFQYRGIWRAMFYCLPSKENMAFQKLFDGMLIVIPIKALK